MKVYIAGPIRGYPDGNRAAFEAAAKTLKYMGHNPINPHDVPILEHEGPCLGAEAGEGREHRYGCYMVPDIAALLECDGYTLLHGWKESKGASVERDVAIICGKQFLITRYGPKTPL